MNSTRMRDYGHGLPEIEQALNKFGGVARYVDLGVIVHIVTEADFDEGRMSALSTDIQGRAEEAITSAVSDMSDLKNACVVVELAESSGILMADNLRLN